MTDWNQLDIKNVTDQKPTNNDDQIVDTLIVHNAMHVTNDWTFVKPFHNVEMGREPGSYNNSSP